MANTFGRNGGYTRSDKTPATSSRARHKGKTVPQLARAEKTMSLNSHRYVDDSEPPLCEILSGKRAITVDTGLRLSRYFSLNDGFWTGLQLDHDAAQANKSLAKVLLNIKPLEIA